MDTLEAPTGNSLTNLEQALVQAEQRFKLAAEAILKLNALVAASRKALAGGDLKGLRRSLGSISEQSLAMDALRAGLDEVWPFSEQEEERYFNLHYKQELLVRGFEQGLNISEQEGLLACYPSLLKIQAKERAVSIDRKVSREVRPSKLLARLVANQKRPTRFNRDFLPALHKTYQEITGQSSGAVAKLREIYERWTRRPGSSKDYSIQEFTKQVYELDGSERSPEEPAFRLHAGATASKNRSNLLIMCTREGTEVTYYGIEFL